MITSGMTMGVSPVEDDAGVVITVSSFEDRLGALVKEHGEETDALDGIASRSLARQEHENEFEMLSPYPTSETIQDIDWSPNGNMALLAGFNGLVMTYDRVYFEVVGTGIDYDLYSVSWHPTGDHALIVGRIGTLLKYENGAIEKINTGTSSALVGADYSPEGDLLLMVSSDGSIYKYDGNRVRYITDLNINLEDVSWHPSDGTALIAGYEWIDTGNGWYAQARVFEYDSATDEVTYLDTGLPQDQDTDLYTVDWSDDGDVALLGGWNGLILSYDGDVFGTVTFRSTWRPVFGIEFSSRGEALCVGAYGLLFLYDNGDFEDISMPTNDLFNSVDFSPGGDTGLVVGYYGIIYDYDPVDQSFEKVSFGTNVNLNAIEWKPDWDYALLVGSGGSIFKYDGNSLEEIGSPTFETLLDVSWSPTGNRALIVGTGGTLIEFNDGGFGDPIINQRLSGTNMDLWGVDYSPTGRALLVGESGEVREWNGNFATKVVSRTQTDLRAVEWKDSSTAYITGVGGTVLRYRTAPTGHIDIASPSNIFVGATLESLVWDEDKTRGLMVGSSGTMIEHYENADATTLDDSYAYIQTDIVYDLYDLDWTYDKDDALVVGDFGTVFSFRDATDAIDELEPPTNVRLTGVDWKGDDYALIVGNGGTVMRYWPNVAPPAVILNSPIDITDNSMKLSWTRSDIHDFHHYEVHMSTQEDFDPSAHTRVKTITDAKTTTYVITELSRDTTYYFKVRVVDTGGLFADSNEVYGHTMMGQLPPKAVTLYDPTDITSSAMMLSWSRNRDVDFDHYELHMSLEEGFEPSGATAEEVIDDQFETEYSVQDLDSNTTYYFKLRVVDEDGLYNDSNEVNGTTESMNYPPEAVTLYEPYNITDDTMSVNWSKCEEADFWEYELHSSTDEDFNITGASLEVVITESNDTEYRFENLTPETTYYMKVRVFDTEGLNADSNEVSATTLEYNEPPEAVELYDPVNITENTMRLNWSANNDTDFEKYSLHMDTETDFTPNTSNLVDDISDQNLTTYLVQDLVPGNTYLFKLRVYDTIMQFADSNEVMGTTISNAPPEAVNLSVSNIGNDFVSLRWTRNEDTDFARYEVHYSEEETFVLDQSNLYVYITSQSTRTSQVDGLLPNVTYYFQVRVVDEFNLFNDSNIVNATTVGENIPPRSVVLGEPQNITRTSMELYWGQSPDHDFSYYELHKDDVSGFEPDTSTRVLKFTDINQTFYNITGLKMDAEYYFVVVVVDTGGLSNDSNEVMGKTLPPNEKPIADAGNDVTRYTTQKVQFNGVGIDPDGTITKFQWDFETDGTWDFESAATGQTENLYTVPGSYVATFRVTDNDGATAEDIANITIQDEPLPNQPPKANAGPDQEITLGEVVYFEATAEDPDGVVTLFEWDYDGDGEYDDYSYSDASGEFQYVEEGIYKARLRVMDNENATHSDIAIITVNPKNTPPVADIDSPYAGRKYYTDDYISFDGSTSSDEDGDRLTYEWTISTKSGVLSTKKKFSKQLNEGRHVISLKVSDGEDEDEAEVTITVNEPENEEPEIRISEPKKNTKVKGIVTISGTATDDDGVIEKVCVKIGAGSCQKAEGRRNWFYEWNTKNAKKGPNTIKAIATDDRGAEVEASVVVTVKKDEEPEKGFFESIPGFEAPVMLAAAAIVTLAITAKRRRDRRKG
jgi:photosystem II stability/assembly factor-like uncharacterized protein